MFSRRPYDLKNLMRGGASPRVLDLYGLHKRFPDLAQTPNPLFRHRGLNRCFLTDIERFFLGNNRLVNLSPLLSFSNDQVIHINLEGNDTALCHQLEQVAERFPGKVVLPYQCFNLGALLPAISLL